MGMATAIPACTTARTRALRVSDDIKKQGQPDGAATLSGLSGSHGGRDYGPMELRADPLVHRLPRCHICDRSVLVLTDVCPQRNSDNCM